MKLMRPAEPRGSQTTPTVSARKMSGLAGAEVLDAVRADHLSLKGSRRPTTPNLERLATDGIQFENALATVRSTPIRLTPARKVRRTASDTSRPVPMKPGSSTARGIGSIKRPFRSTTTRSVGESIPTRSVGTRKRKRAPRPGSSLTLRWCLSAQHCLGLGRVGHNARSSFQIKVKLGVVRIDLGCQTGGYLRSILF